MYVRLLFTTVRKYTVEHILFYDSCVKMYSPHACLREFHQNFPVVDIPTGLLLVRAYVVNKFKIPGTALGKKIKGLP